MPKIGAYFIQAVATVIGSLLCASYGLMYGITSKMLLLYQSNETSLMWTINTEQASWITSYLCIGAVIGSLISGYLSDKWGRKPVLLLAGLIQVSSWFCIIFGYTINHIYCSRIAGGLAAGCTFTILPTYISEIADDNSRGSLGSVITTMRNLGIVMGFIFNAYLPESLISFIGLGISIFFSLSFPFCQESPYYYVAKNQLELMEKSLRWFRAIRCLEDRTKPSFISEVQKFKLIAETNKAATKIDGGSKLGCCYMIKVCFISCVLITVSQFCGIFAILNYADTLLGSMPSKIGLSMEISTIILAIMQFIGAYFANLLSDKINRKTLLGVSSFGSTIFLLTFGFYIYYYQNLNIITSEFMTWIPLVCLCGHIFIANLGLYPLTFVIVSEIIPQKIKGALMSVFLAFLWLLAMFSVKFYYALMENFGLAGCIWIFGGFCIFEFCFIFFIPETRGKSLDEIQQTLGGST